MASPTIAETHTMLKNEVDLLEELRKFAESNAKNFVGMEDTIVQSLETDFAVELTNAVAGARAGINGALAQATAILDPVFRTYGKVIGAPEADVQTIITRFIEYCVANSITFNSRDVTFGSVSAGGSNVGNGTWNRLTKDKYNYDIEAVFAEAVTATCVADQSINGLKHAEEFEVRGASPSRDLLALAGSGHVQAIACAHAGNSKLSNPSFSRYTGTAATPTAIEGWTPVSSISNYAIDESNYYRGFPGDTLNSGDVGSASLKISANDTIAQALTVFGTVLDPDVPMYAQIAYNRQVGSGDGTLTLHMGGVSASVSLAAQTGWNILRIALGQNNWHRQFNEADLDIKVQLASRTTGYVLVDDLIFVPFVRFGLAENLIGTWMCPVGGSTPFLRGDVFTYTDSIASDSKIQRWLFRAYGRYLPHATAAGETVTDP